MAENVCNTAAVSDMSHQDILIKYWLDNKINKTVLDELLKRGFDSLDALKLVKMEDLSSQNIPKGQRRLIFHIAQALNTNQPASTQIGTVTTLSAGNAGVSHTTRSTMEQPNDVYSSTLLDTLLQQQTQIASSDSSPTGTVTQNPLPSSQPSWNDPQIHIASATGKSASTFLDICDFVPQSTEEDLVIGGQGDQQLLIKSGPKKPRLESLTLSQWSIANLAILYKLVGDGKLVGASLMDYLSYTTKVYQLVQRFSLASVLLYDREYRKIQSTMNFRWGTDVQHLHTLFLQPRSNSSIQTNPIVAKRGAANQSGTRSRPDRRTDNNFCRNFNSDKGCSYEQCKFRHRCLVPGCGHAHSAVSHSNLSSEKK